MAFTKKKPADKEDTKSNKGKKNKGKPTVKGNPFANAMKAAK